MAPRRPPPPPATRRGHSVVPARPEFTPARPEFAPSRPSRNSSRPGPAAADHADSDMPTRPGGASARVPVRVMAAQTIEGRTEPVAQRGPGPGPGRIPARISGLVSPRPTQMVGRPAAAHPRLGCDSEGPGPTRTPRADLNDQTAAERDGRRHLTAQCASESRTVTGPRVGAARRLAGPLGAPGGPGKWERGGGGNRLGGSGGHGGADAGRAPGRLPPARTRGDEGRAAQADGVRAVIVCALSCVCLVDESCDLDDNVCLVCHIIDESCDMAVL